MGERQSKDAILRAVSAAVLAVTRHLSAHEVLQVIVRSARELLGARYGALGIPDEDGAFAEFVADGISDDEWDRIGKLPRQHGMLGVLLREEKAVRLDDIRADPRFGWWPRAHPVMADFLGVPIRDGGSVLGIIFLANKETPGGFTPEDERLLELFAGHAAIAITNARLYERSQELSVMAERGRLARDLHDAVAQKLFSLRLTAKAAGTLVMASPERALAQMEQVERLAGEALDELRSVIVELAPPDLAADGLVRTLVKQARLLDRLHPAEVTCAADSDATGLPPAAETVVFRIAQEALHNALRHSGAAHVELRMACGEEAFTLAVDDDGAGFDTRAAATKGLGLQSMSVRATELGGRLDVRTGPGAGTTISLVVPHG
ncbi:GAF domain-containing sensor histidine kinase [Phytomonospora sp. NPDC050363]|uniref:GAF domain-containing sensor histidine kinase n=1 Tax=Phytomonospora sp. NPDC050363 TaxID=3155642 RepID=UPI0033CC6B76